MANERQQCRVTAMNLLARREHSFLELKNKLCLKDYPQDVVESVLRALQDDNLLSDQRYAESYVRLRAAKGYGPVRIRQELRERGIDGELQTEAMSDTDWYPLACAARSKRFGDERPVEFREQARQVRFLQYRGFTSDHIRRVMTFDE